MQDVGQVQPKNVWLHGRLVGDFFGVVYRDELLEALVDQAKLKNEWVHGRPRKTENQWLHGQIEK